MLPEYPDRVRDILAQLNSPIALIGMMGAGKSRLAKSLAKTLYLPLIDLDSEIEQAAGLTIPEIFDRLGEPAFRDIEAKAMRHAVEEGRKTVIATGGGTLMNPEIAALTFARTLTMWVRAPLELMIERTSRNKDRPLLKDGDVEEKLKALMAVRYPVYEKATIIVDSHDGPASETLAQALGKLHDHLGGSTAD